MTDPFAWFDKIFLIGYAVFSLLYVKILIFLMLLVGVTFVFWVIHRGKK